MLQTVVIFVTDLKYAATFAAPSLFHDTTMASFQFDRTDAETKLVLLLLSECTRVWESIKADNNLSHCNLHALFRSTTLFQSVYVTPYKNLYRLKAHQWRPVLQASSSLDEHKRSGTLGNVDWNNRRAPYYSPAGEMLC